MSVPSPGAADSALSAVAGTSMPADSPLPGSNGGGSALGIGRRWRTYQVTKAFGAGFLATDATAMEEVVIHARPIDDDTPMRRETCERLLQLPSDGLVPVREAHEENGWRYEISAVPAGVPLREWIACHRMGLSEIESLVRQVTVQLEALHEHGVVHLRIQPQSIFVDEVGGGLHVLLGGFEAATLHAQTDLVPIAVNPYYAPPEAAGLFRHKPGPDLCAWDWWSLGRLVQEIVHGTHVYGLLFERDVSAEPPELRARAEAALMERDPSGVRAGAVELLPDGTSPRLRTLLRGLLASSRDGRWRGDQVLHWLQQENVPDRYDLPRDARLFWWRRRAFTVPEAAAFFLHPDYAFDGQQQFFPTGPGEPTMRQFLAEMPSLRAEQERVEQILALAESLPWQQWPLTVRRAAVAGLAWRSLAPANGPTLCVLRWRIEPSGMQEMFADATPAEALWFARVLGTGPYRRAVEAIDAAAGRTLALLAEAGLSAIEQAVARNLVAAGDDVGQARLLWFAFESDKDLLARRDRLRSTYATAQDGALAALLTKEKPTRVELMLLAFAGERAREFGFVTHAEWANRRAAELTARAQRVRAAIFWRRLARVLSVSPALLASPPLFVAVWAAPVALAVAARSWPMAAGFVVAALLLRVIARLWLNDLIARHTPEAAAWTWRDGAARARREARERLAEVPPEKRADMRAELAVVCAEFRELGLKNVVPPEEPSRLRGLWSLAAVANVVPLVFCLLPWLGVDLAPRPEPVVILRHGPAQPADGTITSKNGEIFEIYDDGFGRRPRGPLRAWDVPAVETPQPLPVRRVQAASANQRAYARVGGELLLEPYPRKDLKFTLAVPVPANGEWGVVLYDTAERELADRRTFFLPAAPQEKMWYWIGNRRVVYLGPPPRLPPLQNSLAPP